MVSSSTTPIITNDQDDTCNKSFCSNYLLLKPEEASFTDLFKILFSSNIGKRKFVDCPDETYELFPRRWIIFFSVLAQKVLGAMSKPLAGLGSGIENWLNLISENGGFFRLISNSIKGKLVHPDTSSPKFVSFLGFVDQRTELDSNIGYEDERYYSALAIMAAKQAYENSKSIESVVKEHWEMNFMGFYEFWNDYQGKATTQAFLFEDKHNTIIVSFRGTEPFNADQWSSDFDISWYELPGLGKLHAGFMKALGLHKSQGWPQEQDPAKPSMAYYTIRKILKEKLLENEKAEFVLTGHSLGGALAALFPAVLAYHGESDLLDRLKGVYTFGQPRVGDEDVEVYMNNLIKKHNIDFYRFVYCFDMVPRLPYDDATQLFKHFGTCIYYNSLYKGKVVSEVHDKNYFSIIWIVPKFLNVCWEFIRSFFIAFVKGPNYREGGVLRMFRMTGFLCAGVPAHCAQDYVNSTRLGSADVFNSNKTLKVQ